jgi:hypothetical protein
MRDDPQMRTTLDLDHDVLQAVKEIAARRKKTAGQVVSELARKALEPRQAGRIRNGVPVLPRRSGTPLLTVERVNQLLDEP